MTAAAWRLRRQLDVESGNYSNARLTFVALYGWPAAARRPPSVAWRSVAWPCRLSTDLDSRMGLLCTQRLATRRRLRRRIRMLWSEIGGSCFSSEGRACILAPSSRGQRRLGLICRRSAMQYANSLPSRVATAATWPTSFSLSPSRGRWMMWRASRGVRNSRRPARRSAGPSRLMTCTACNRRHATGSMQHATTCDTQHAPDDRPVQAGRADSIGCAPVRPMHKPARQRLSTVACTSARRG